MQTANSGHQRQSVREQGLFIRAVLRVGVALMALPNNLGNLGDTTSQIVNFSCDRREIRGLSIHTISSGLLLPLPTTQAVHCLLLQIGHGVVERRADEEIV